jgi:mannan endo-1,4-beta-mannosidase
VTIPSHDPAIPPSQPGRHGRQRTGQVADGPRLPVLGRRMARVFQNRVVAIVITIVAVISVAAVTFVVVEIAAPNRPLQQPPLTSTTPAIGAFSHHPVRIKLPASPDSYLGAYVDGVPRHYAPLASFTASAAQPNIALYYSGWGEPFQTSFATQVTAHNAVPLIQVEPGRTSLAAIAAGEYDTYLETYATAVASFGAQTGKGVIISFGHEPNGPWYPWGSGHASPATWIAAWRHIVDVFRQQGADDVTWLWTVNIIATQSKVVSPVPWWPGSSYVTWIGIDGYYYKPSWTFASLFGPTIKAVRTLALDPILVSETGVAPAAGQPEKITNLFAGIRAYGLLGFVWFDAKRKEDWRISTPAAAAAFRGGAKTLKEPAS